MDWGRAAGEEQQVSSTLILPSSDALPFVHYSVLKYSQLFVLFWGDSMLDINRDII